MSDPPRIIAHRLAASGAVPNHPRWPLLANGKGHAAAIARVALPQCDPLYGEGGPLLTHWE